MRKTMFPLSIHIHFYWSPKDWLKWKNVALNRETKCFSPWDWNGLRKWHCRTHFHWQIAPVTVWLGSCSKGMNDLRVAVSRKARRTPGMGARAPCRSAGELQVCCRSKVHRHGRAAYRTGTAILPALSFSLRPHVLMGALIPTLKCRYSWCFSSGVLAE